MRPLHDFSPWSPSQDLCLIPVTTEPGPLGISCSFHQGWRIWECPLRPFLHCCFFCAPGCSGLGKRWSPNEHTVFLSAPRPSACAPMGWGVSRGGGRSLCWSTSGHPDASLPELEDPSTRRASHSPEDKDIHWAPLLCSIAHVNIFLALIFISKMNRF